MTNNLRNKRIRQATVATVGIGAVVGLVLKPLFYVATAFIGLLGAVEGIAIVILCGLLFYAWSEVFIRLTSPLQKGVFLLFSSLIFSGAIVSLVQVLTTIGFAGLGLVGATPIGMLVGIGVAIVVGLIFFATRSSGARVQVHDAKDLLPDGSERLRMKDDSAQALDEDLTAAEDTVVQFSSPEVDATREARSRPSASLTLNLTPPGQLSAATIGLRESQPTPTPIIPTDSQLVSTPHTPPLSSVSPLHGDNDDFVLYLNNAIGDASLSPRHQMSSTSPSPLSGASRGPLAELSRQSIPTRHEESKGEGSNSTASTTTRYILSKLGSELLTLGGDDKENAPTTPQKNKYETPSCSPESPEPQQNYYGTPILSPGSSAKKSRNGTPTCNSESPDQQNINGTPTCDNESPDKQKPEQPTGLSPVVRQLDFLRT